MKKPASLDIYNSEDRKKLLAKFGRKNMSPDWNELEAARESLREHMAMVKTLKQRIEALAATLNGVRGMAVMEVRYGSKPWAKALVLIDQALDIKKAPG